MNSTSLFFFVLSLLSTQSFASAPSAGAGSGGDDFDIDAFCQEVAAFRIGDEGTSEAMPAPTTATSEQEAKLRQLVAAVKSVATVEDAEPKYRHIITFATTHKHKLEKDNLEAFGAEMFYAINDLSQLALHLLDNLGKETIVTTKSPILEALPFMHHITICEYLALRTLATEEREKANIGAGFREYLLKSSAFVQKLVAEKGAASVDEL